MTTTTNIEDFKKQYRNFYRNLLMIDDRTVGEIMQGHVLNTAMQHRQSGDMIRALQNDVNIGADWLGMNGKPNWNEPRRLVIGFGAIDFIDTVKRRQQWAVFQTTLKGKGFQGKYKDERVFNLKSEPDLPEWILLEFGRHSGSGVSTGDVPAEFQVNYSDRGDKPFMFGPSISRHFTKSVFFMFDGEEQESNEDYNHVSNSYKNSLKRHPGTKATHMFQKGLEQAKPDILMALNHGMKQNLIKYAQKNGGKVE